MKTTQAVELDDLKLSKGLVELLGDVDDEFLKYNIDTKRIPEIVAVYKAIQDEEKEDWCDEQIKEEGQLLIELTALHEKLIGLNITTIIR